MCSVCLFKCTFHFLHYCSLDACFNSWVTKITPHRLTLSLAWISAPFLISTSMIWMLPQPAAIRRGEVPCCNTNNMIKWVNDWLGCVPHMSCCLPCWVGWHRSCLRSRVNAWDRVHYRHLWHGWWPSSQRSLPHPRWVSNIKFRHSEEYLILSKIKSCPSHAL